MSVSTVESDLVVDINTFAGRAKVEDGVLRIVLAGQADLAALPHVERLLQGIHRKALEMKASEIVLDIRGVEFMNSSCLAKMVAWITLVREAGADAQYRIRILSNDQFSWQRRSMQALRCFAVDLITVQPA
jgi:hypothetical protein